VVCPDCAGEYVPGIRTIRIERMLVDADGLALQQALAHEIGHHVDSIYLTDALRRRFRELRGIPPDLSREAPDQAWTQRPVEDFAEVFAVLDVPLVESGPRTAFGAIGAMLEA
jgi:hypothetical protein